MKQRTMLFLAYCAVTLCVPKPPHPYTFFISTVTYTLNFFFLHYFRSFLFSGTPASKTMFHGLVWSLTICYQLQHSVFYCWGMFGTVFRDFSLEMIETHPSGACILASTRYVSLPMFYYLFYLSTLKLVIACKPNLFLELNPDKLVTQLNVSVCLLLIADRFAALAINGTTCNPRLATFIMSIVGYMPVGENLLGDPSSLKNRGFLFINFILILGTVVEYAIAEIIVKRFLSRLCKFCSQKLRALKSNLYNLGRVFRVTDNSVEPLFNVASPESYQLNPAFNLEINNFPAPDEPSTIQKVMALLKGLGFFVGFLLCPSTTAFLFIDELGDVLAFIIYMGFNILFQCMPLYWVLVVDSVYEFTRRRVGSLASAFFHH